ncbi:DegT/DnrJ/EryC1/StrS aminotransferase family enzyme [Janthinobacterium sp. Marseille]|nr:DegT/DnrJ/EryC1/StrS family aminotransferase [Janthinobacterium sp. Marseille]ABR91601.1 DegT/DnrJ/EryC1/StrS aminotransferase family enzyme [Janthinobacterium sp. Marseille]
MKVPFIDITRFEAGFKQRWLAKVEAMSSGAQFIGGIEVETLEKRLVETLGVSYAVGCANGTDALQLALRALGVGAGDTVLVPNATFWATFEAVVNVGASPATVDVNIADGGVDLNAFEQALVEAKPKAAMIVHLYGWGSARLNELRSLCLKHSVPLLEDGAQCFGVKYQDESIFKGAHISTTSFYPAKVLGAAGDGGAVFTNDPVLADKVRRLGNHGRTAHYGYGDVGWNSRLDALQAAFLNISLDYIDARIESRQKSASFYREQLPAVGLAPMSVPEGYTENGYCNVCLVPDKNEKSKLEKLLKERSIGFGNIYPGVMSAQVGAAPYLKAQYGGSQANVLCESVLNLPLFPYMTSEELEYVISAVRDSGVKK